MSITLDDFTYAYKKLKPFLQNTPLELYKDNIYLKKESQQKTGSFKWAGVLYAVMNIFETLLTSKIHPYYIVTQSTGNHGIAVIEATRVMIEQYISIYPDDIHIWKNVIPCIFANKRINDTKLNKMRKYLNNFPYNAKGFVNNSFNNYHHALLARTNFLQYHNGSYVEHGGKHMLTGYGSIAFSIHEQLPQNKSVALYTAVGAGGPVGIGMCLSLLRNTTFIVSQTKEYDAFNRTLYSTEIQANSIHNHHSISDGVSNGIAVDKPEEYAIIEGRNVIYKAITVTTNNVEKLVNETKLGGSSCIALSAINAFKPDVDYIIVLDCEGNA
jgi:threonine dehydratase